MGSKSSNCREGRRCHTDRRLLFAPFFRTQRSILKGVRLSLLRWLRTLSSSARLSVQRAQGDTHHPTRNCWFATWIWPLPSLCFIFFRIVASCHGFQKSFKFNWERAHLAAFCQAPFFRRLRSRSRRHCTVTKALPTLPGNLRSIQSELYLEELCSMLRWDALPETLGLFREWRHVVPKTETFNVTLLDQFFLSQKTDTDVGNEKTTHEPCYCYQDTSKPPCLSWVRLFLLRIFGRSSKLGLRYRVIEYELFLSVSVLSQKAFSSLHASKDYGKAGAHNCSCCDF